MTGRRAQKRRDTTDRFGAVALDLFARKGYEATSVAEIAAAASVSERTYFRYFPSKQDVLFCGVADDIELFSQILADALRADEPTWDDVAAALWTYAVAQEPTRSVNRLRAELVRATPSLQPRASHLLADWRTRAVTVLADRYGRRRDDPDVQLLAGITTAVLVAGINSWIAEDAVSFAEAVERAALRARRLLWT